MTLIDPWVIYVILGIPIAAGLLALLLVVLIGTQSWRHIRPEVAIFVVVLAIAVLPQVIW